MIDECSDRTLDNSSHAKMFAVAYDLLHSHENPEKAAKALPKLTAIMDSLSDSDRAKVDILITKIKEAIKNMKEQP